MIAEAIREAAKSEETSIWLLAQLSMAIFKLSCPDPVRDFGFPVLTSGETGFERIKQIFKGSRQ